MKSRRILWLIFFGAAVSLTVWGDGVESSVGSAGEPAARAREKPVTAEWFISRVKIAPGESVPAALRLKLDEGWHIYTHQEPTYTATKIATDGASPFTLEKIEYPKGLPVDLFGERVSVYQGAVWVRAKVKATDAAPNGPNTLRVAVSFQACKEQCLPPTSLTLSVPLEIVAAGRAGDETRHRELSGEESPAEIRPDDEGSSPTPKPVETPESIWWMLIFGVGGGMILNVMPCVLPVVSLKIFGLVSQSGATRRAVRLHGLIYALGVWVSMIVLAGAVVVLQAAGEKIGWGFQFQNPYFTIFLGIVVMVFGLSLLGVFEFPLLGLAGVGKAVARHSLAGSFVNGVFAVLLATPCTAPFLGTAVAFALKQPPAAVFAVFSAIALGLALPFLLIAFIPAWAKLLPKPGNWMVVVKEIMGFLLLGTLVWLLHSLNVLVAHAHFTGVMAFLCLTAGGCWAIGKWASAGASSRAIFSTRSLVAIALLLGGYIWLRPPLARIAWQPFSLPMIQHESAGGRPIFVVATAEWCLTCKANETTVIETDEIAKLLKKLNYLAVKADFTQKDLRVLAWLNANGSAAVPLYVIVPSKRFAERLVLPVVLTRRLLAEKLKAGARENTP